MAKKKKKMQLPSTLKSELQLTSVILLLSAVNEESSAVLEDLFFRFES